MSEHDAEVALTWHRASSLSSVARLGTDEITLAERGGSAFRIRREPAAVVIDVPDEISVGALVHPLLTVPLSLVARWRGYVTLHAGAFEANGAWAVLGDRTTGKSSMLAALAERGVPIVADDLLVIDDGWALAGPRCVDLRPDASERFPAARVLGVVGGRPRLRLSTPPAPPRTLLRGFFVLEWSESRTPEIAPVDMRDRLKLLYGQPYMGVAGAGNPRRILELLGLPAWRLRRPRDWDATSAAADRLLAVANGQARQRAASQA